MCKEAGRIWASAKRLFYPLGVEKALKQELPRTDLRLGIYVFLAAALVSAILTTAVASWSIYMAAFEYKVLAEVSDIGKTEIWWGDLAPVALFQFLFMVPFSLVFSLVYEGIIYKIMRLTGGKGGFTKQYYLSSLVAFSLAMSLALGFLLPVPCFWLLAVLGILLLTLYFTFYVNVKAYQLVHGVSYLHALVIVLLLVIPKLLAIMFVANKIAILFGLSEFSLVGV